MELQCVAALSIMDLILCAVLCIKKSLLEGESVLKTKSCVCKQVKRTTLHNK